MAGRAAVSVVSLVSWLTLALLAAIISYVYIRSQVVDWLKCLTRIASMQLRTMELQALSAFDLNL